MNKPITEGALESHLTEIQRQQKYLSRLPDDYQFPLFSGRQAVESQRKSGYKTTARAAREIIDNALEAGAANLWVAVETVKDSQREKFQRKNTVTSVAFIDDGPGMSPKMARLALSWGGGTHFDGPEFIGKFGFGLPNSSINQTRRVEVYTRTSAGEPWLMAWLDINDVPEFGLVTIEEPREAPLPKYVSRFLAREGIVLDSGTIVVWDRPDRLTYTQESTLMQHLRHDFGVTYRYILDDFAIHVGGKTVKKVDPFFLMRDAMFYEPDKEKGAQLSHEQNIPVKSWRDPSSGGSHLAALTDEQELLAAQEDPNVEAIGTINVKVVRFPVGFAMGSGVERDDPRKKRFEIRKSRRGMSFVRAGREIEMIDAFPRSEADKASGLGDWPLLQGYAYHWGIEVRFGPALDDVFGIGNDKQSVAPNEDFWRVLAQYEIDRLLKEENKFQRKQREKQKQESVLSEEGTNAATEAAARAEDITGPRPMSNERKQEAQNRLKEAAGKRAKETDASFDQALRAIEEEAARKRYRIEFFDAPGGVFFIPDLGTGLQKVAMINRAHAFFENLYAPLTLNDPSARHAIDVLLLALTKAELEATTERGLFYKNERENHWSPFLSTALAILADVEQPTEEDSEEDE